MYPHFHNAQPAIVQQDQRQTSDQAVFTCPTYIRRVVGGRVVSVRRDAVDIVDDTGIVTLTPDYDV